MANETKMNVKYMSFEKKEAKGRRASVMEGGNTHTNPYRRDYTKYVGANIFKINAHTHTALHIKKRNKHEH